MRESLVSLVSREGRSGGGKNFRQQMLIVVLRTKGAEYLEEEMRQEKFLFLICFVKKTSKSSMGMI